MNVRFFTGAYLSAGRVERLSLEVSVQREIVQTAVGKAITVILEGGYPNEGQRG